MRCPVCGHEVDDADYWVGDMCLRCALVKEQKKSKPKKEAKRWPFRTKK